MFPAASVANALPFSSTTWLVRSPSLGGEVVLVSHGARPRRAAGRRGRRRGRGRGRGERDGYGCRAKSWPEAAEPGCRAKENTTEMEEKATEMENATGMEEN
jgi:hypothetical protein